MEIKRSEIHPSDYNPRKMDAEQRKLLKKSIKTYGVVGGIVVNKRTGNTIVGGHQKVSVLDELHKFPEKDYTLKVEMVDLDAKVEKELNVVLNNPNVGGEWDYDKLRELIPEIDYKNTGLTESDLSLIGLDYLFQTQEESNIANDFNELMLEANEQHEAEVAQRKEQRDAIKQVQAEAQEQLERAEKTQHMKDVKQQVKEQAIERAQNMDAYVMLSFDTYEAKSAFMQRFGFDPMMKFIKGEDFDERCEVVYE